MGHQLAIQRLALIGMLTLSVLCGWLWLQLERLHGQNDAMMAQNTGITQQLEENIRQLQQTLLEAKLADFKANESQQPPQLSDFAGNVIDNAGQPLRDAQLLVILKTWPEGRYQQEAFSAKSDAGGRFCLPKLVPINKQYAVQVAALKSGYAFKSAYQLKQGHASEEPKAVNFQLEKAPPLTLVLRDKSDRPVPNVLIAPSARRPTNDEEQSVYFQASEPVRFASDAQGEVNLPYFGAGDDASVHVQVPGHDWEERHFVVTVKDNKIVLSITGSSNGDRRDGNHTPTPRGA